MIEFHYCKQFLKKINGQLSIVENKFLELSNRNSLTNSGSMRDYGNGLYSLHISSISSKIIIQKHRIRKNDIHFVRDVIETKDRGFIFRAYIFPDLKSGEYIQKNPLPEVDIEAYEEQLKKQTLFIQRQNEVSQEPPEHMLKWLNEFKLNIKYDIFETEEWVKYALNDSDNIKMRDRDVKLFSELLNDIVYNNFETEIFTSVNHRKFYAATTNNVGILFSKIIVENTTRFILHNGAHLKTQVNHWSNAIKALKANTPLFDNTIENLARNAFRAYPKWTLKNDELWFVIQKNTELSNLSLTEDQLLFFKDFKFPYYINGQAGSGKSTMLYYLFANGIYYQLQNLIKGNLIFLTENAHLLQQTQKSVFDLLSNNPEFEVNNAHLLSDLDDKFSSFKDFLINQVPVDDRSRFNDDKYLDFIKFKELYEGSKLKDSDIRKYSSEECWFTIRTYIYGYRNEEKLSSNDYLNIVPQKSQSIPIEKYRGIEEKVLPFYDRLLEDGYWDKLYIIRYLEKNRNRIPLYELVVCDEAQDFCRVELRFILKLSEYLNFNLSNVDQIPIIFAGDPNQTVNPTGFRESEMTEMLHTELNSLAKFDYKNKDSVYNPKYNYRSKHPVVTLANFIQFYRKKNLEIRLASPQIPKRPYDERESVSNLFFSDINIVEDASLLEDFLKKIQYKIFIVPVDTLEKDEFKLDNTLLESVEDAEIKTSVEAKGAEYDQVVLYGFGEYFISLFENLETSIQDELDVFRRSYFFNKLYVGITRAQKELIIVDSPRAKTSFWKKLVEKAEISSSNWNILNDYKDETILYDPDTLGSVIQSNEEHALSNAKQDKSRGIFDRNSARLVVAANQFYKIGEFNEYYICKALSLEFKGKWKEAAELYIKAEGSNNLANAARCFFNGKHFIELENFAGVKIKTPKQNIRLIASRFMMKNKIDVEDIDRLNNNRELVSSTLNGISWRSDLIEKIINYNLEETDTKMIRGVAEILNVIANGNDKRLWEIVGNLYFKISGYNKAVKAWDKAGDIQKKEYVKAKVEISRDKNDYQNLIIWLNELKNHISEDDIKSKIENEIIYLYESELKDKDLESFGVLSIYKSYLIQSPEANIHILGKQAEKAFSKQREIIKEEYEHLLLSKRLSSKVYDFVLKRYLKNSQLINENKNLKPEESQKQLNQDYKSLNDLLKLKTKNLSFADIQNLPKYPDKILFEPPKHLQSISISNFRHFQNLELEDLSQFNLIVGDNNVGKTSLLEALTFDYSTEKFIRNLAYSYKERLNLPRLLDQTQNEFYNIPVKFFNDFICSRSEDQNIRYKIWDDVDVWNYSFRRLTDSEINNNIQQSIGFDNDKILGFFDNDVLNVVDLELILKKLIPSESLESPLIPFGKGFSKDLAQIYFDNIDKIKSVRNEFLENMRVFIPNIERIIADTDSGEITIEESNSDFGHMLYEYGEGANKLFRILVQITLQKDNRLLIDEIDAGIHHTRFQEFWQTIILFAKKNNTQIFATTHNLECITYFDILLREDNFSEFQDLSRVLTLKRIEANNVKVYTRKFQEFNYELENNFELRGE